MPKYDVTLREGHTHSVVVSAEVDAPTHADLESEIYDLLTAYPRADYASVYHYGTSYLFNTYHINNKQQVALKPEAPASQKWGFRP